MRSATSQFKVLKQLGKGGCGRALLAKDIKTSELMVIKEIIFSEKEDSQRTAALNEIKVIEKLKHNNIIKLYGSSSSNEKILLLMEYADGGDLESLIQNQNKKLFDENKILDIFTQLCFAVKYLHDRKILHRDLKPSNVFMTNKGTVKLGDFGFAKALASTISLAETQVGTPYYISPEILKGKQYSYSTDIWSLGAILYELTALNHPFEAEDLTELMMKIMNERAPRVPSRYSDELRNLVSKMLQKKPNLRPTIYEILETPIVKYKAITLLGTNVAEKELIHGTLHRTAIELPENQAIFSFMGKPLNMKGKTEAKDQMEVAKKFAVKMIGEEMFEILMNNRKDALEIESNDSVVKLIDQLISFKQKNNLS